MDDQRLGAAFRAARVRRQLRQSDFADHARVSLTSVRRLERGALGGLSLRLIRQMANALGIRLSFKAWMPGGDLDRMLNARHAALHESVARSFANLPGWRLMPEVSFSHYGERG